MESALSELRMESGLSELRMESGLPVPTIISKCCELVKLCHSSPVFFATQCR